MSETHQHRETAVEQVRRVRDHLNREIEATTGKALLDQVHGHQPKTSAARWAARLMPAQPMELMRHESIETTLRFYVGTGAAPPKEPSKRKITEPNQTRPGVIRTHDQGIMSPDNRSS